MIVINTFLFNPIVNNPLNPTAKVSTQRNYTHKSRNHLKTRVRQNPHELCSTNPAG